MRSPLILLAMALVLHPMAVFPAVTISNPDLFEKTWLGTAQTVEHFALEGRDDDLKRVTEMGYRLARESEFESYPFAFFVVDMPEPNAFALPGGQIFVTRGMLDLGLDDDQLAALLGHEIAHVTENHGVRLQRKATLLNILSQALLVGVMVGASKSRDTTPSPYPYDYGDNTGDLIQGAAAAGLILNELLLRSNSREFEDEADEEGQRMAAAAGYDPDGARQLMDLLHDRLPQNEEYGYWRSHPFFSSRVRVAEARGRHMKAQIPADDVAFRKSTQAAYLDFLEEHPQDEAVVERHMKDTALRAWPQGPRADDLRREKLEKLRELEEEKKPLARNYGALLTAYRHHLEEVRGLTPDSPLVKELETQSAQFEQARTALFPTALETFKAGVYETDFLVTFLDNFPEADEVPRATLLLAKSYARLGRQTDAVERFLAAWKCDPDGDVAKESLAGLKGLAPRLDRLAALAELAEEVPDGELAALTAKRLEIVAATYTDLANGADYLRKFPDGALAQSIEERQEGLAQELYGEVLLYQGIGDSMKALERIQQILAHAPHSKAAQRIHEKAAENS